jgi:glycosyltransferase involved in cell wall biosynthesis
MTETHIEASNAVDAAVRPGAAPPRWDVSVVVPVVERHDDLEALHREFSEELTRLGKTFEFLFVVDGGQASVVPALKDLKRRSADEITIVVLGRSFGESAALTVGLERARGRVVVTLASYFQVEPSGMARALASIEGGADLAVGRRHPRVDSPLNRLQSSFFHFLVRKMTGTRFHDISCGFRAMRREVAEGLGIYGDLHRFIPILALNRGFRVVEVEIPQRPEDTKLRYAGVGIYLRRVLDILSVFFLIKFTRKPLRFFGLIGTSLFATGFAFALYLVAYKFLGFGPIANRPLLLLGVLLMVLGVQTLSIGLLGEIIIFTHARDIREYQIAEIL